MDIVGVSFPCQSELCIAAIRLAEIAANPHAIEPLGCNERASESSETIENDFAWSSQVLDQKGHLLDGLRTGMACSEDTKLSLVHMDEHVIRVIPRLSLSALHDPDVWQKAQAVSWSWCVDGRPDTMVPEPLA
jgi:hypothetical protein